MASTLTEHALTTLATVKGELGLTDQSLDAVVERLINAASDAIERECGRHFEHGAEISEKLAGQGRSKLVLSRTPIITVASVSVDGALLAASEYEVADPGAGILYRTAGWPWAGLLRPGIVQDPMPGTERNNIEVTYAAGWVTPAQATAQLPRTLPYDLEQLCIEAAVAMFRQRGQDKAITSERLLSASYTYDRSSGLPTTVLSGLRRYARIAMA